MEWTEDDYRFGEELIAVLYDTSVSAALDGLQGLDLSTIHSQYRDAAKDYIAGPLQGRSMAVVLKHTLLHKQAPRREGWIPVEEELPHTGNLYKVITKEHGVRKGFFYTTSYKWGCGGTVTHWRYLLDEEKGYG